MLSLTAAALLCGALAGCRGHGKPVELRVGFGSGITTIDPHAERTFASFEQLGNVYEPLTQLDQDLRVRPALALSWTNPDLLTWVFRLRAGVLFHDGSPFTADDVVASYQRLLANQDLKMRSYLAGVTEVSAGADGSVVVKTGWPNAQLLSGLSFVPIVKRGATRDGLTTSPNGTGAWRIVAWEPPSRLVLERNERYWGPRPAAGRIVADLGLAEPAAVAGVKSGLYEALRYATPDAENAAKADARYRVVRQPNLYLRHLGYDMARDRTPFVPGIPNPFRRPEVREAVQLALDLPRMAAAVDPQAVPAEQLVPRAVFGYRPGIGLPVRDLPRARQLMKEAGLAGGFDVSLHRSGFATAARVVKEQLAEIGIRVTIVEMQSADFFVAVGRGELSFWIVSNGCPSGDATEALWSSFHAPDPARGAGVDNHAGYRNPELDAKVDEAIRLFEPRLRLPVLQQALSVVLADRVWIPLYYSNDVFIVKRSIGYTPREDGMLRYADLMTSPR